MQILRRPSLGPRSCLFGIGCVIHGRVDSFAGLGQCGIRLPLLIRNRIQGVQSGFMDTEGLKFDAGYSCHPPVVNRFFCYF